MIGTLSNMRTQILDANSKIITLLRFPLIVGVVVIHSACKTGDLLTDTISILFSDIIAKVSVPCFFVISGYLFFVNIDGFSLKQYKNKIRTRLNSLLVPYLIWIAIPIFFKLLRNRELLSLSELLRFFWDIESSIRTNLFGWPIKIAFPLNGPLWFMRDLIILCCISPLIYVFIKWGKDKSLVLLGAIYVFQIWPYITLESMSVFFFSLGAYIGINKKSLVMRCKSIYAISLLLIIACFFFYNTIYFAALLSLYNIVAVFCCIQIAARYMSKNYTIKPILTQSSMFVYTVHRIYIISIVKSVLLPLLFFYSSNSACRAIEYILTPIVTTSVCVIFFKLLRKIFPSFVRFSLGGR